MSDRVPRVNNVSACYSMLAGAHCKERDEYVIGYFVHSGCRFASSTLADGPPIGMKIR